jgi:hypothetical protein
MKNNFLIATFFMICFLSASAQTGEGTKVVNPNAPKIEFKESEFDFKDLDEGPQAKHEFVFKNTGKEPLILTNVKASCGCTTPSWPKEPVLPGQEGKILVTYNTQGRPGPFTKSITITSNASEEAKVIYIKGKVNTIPEKNTVPVKEGNMLSPE